MKVKELYIKSYNQFEDFRLDLTYPLGHPKAGKPLDKVCFIGQSGTGKTSLLEIISKNTVSHLEYPFSTFYSNDDDSHTTLKNAFDVKNVQDGFTGSIKFLDYLEKPLKPESLYIEENIEIFNKQYSVEINIQDNMGGYSLSYVYLSILKEYEDYLKHLSPLIVFYPADIDFKGFDATSKALANIEQPQVVDISILNFNSLWKDVEKDLIKYREDEIKERLTMSEKIQSSLSNKDAIFKAVEVFEKWQKSTVNPITELAVLLDKILNKFNLQVRTKLDFQKTQDISTIKVETLQGDEVSNAFLSTGTKQVILTALPLYSYKPENAIIFFDEPERSLYPDIQKEIVELYTSLTTDCQFFYATHSPIIASSFEPWEIVELKFNPETGKVFQELYYEGERHVDNYTINPQYLRWDDILQRVFDLDSEGNEKRVKALMKLATLESKLKKNSIPLEEREKLWEEYLKLSKLTGWTTRFNYEKN